MKEIVNITENSEISESVSMAKKSISLKRKLMCHRTREDRNVRKKDTDADLEMNK